MSAVALLSDDEVLDVGQASASLATVDEPAGPPWAAEVAARFQHLLALKADWDSYGAPPLREDAVDSAFDLLMQLAQPSTPPPEVVPMVSGGVQFEWHRQGVDLEVEVHSRFRFEVFYEDTATGDTVEEVAVADLTRLGMWVRHLST